MNISHPAVHPLESLTQADGGGGGGGGGGDVVVVPPTVWMKDIQGMPGTPGGLALRFSQFAFAAAALCVMVTTSDFPSVSAFCYLVAASSLQCLWSLSLAMIDVYAILVRRCLRSFKLVSFFTIGDGITSTVTFAAACASGGITVLISNDLNNCSINHCTQFETATAMAFMSWFALSPSFFLNFWSLASR